MRGYILLLIGFGILYPATANAQYFGYPDYDFYDDYSDYYGYHSSTAEEGYGRGLADIIRSQGIYNRLSAEALVQQEEARRQYIENQKQGVETYFRVRELNRTRGDRAKHRESVRQWLEERSPHQPRRPGPNRLNPVTGRIDWPVLLQDGTYVDGRRLMERVFAERAFLGGTLDAHRYETVVTAGKEMLNELKERIDEVRPQDYIVAKRFVEALINEAAIPFSQ